MRRILSCCLAVVFGMAIPAYAQATRTWVSGVGDDANPCSRTAPCKTFAGAISKTAAGGYIDVLDPGGFGAVTITKSITIDGGAGVAGVLVSGTNAINVAAGSSDTVVLRNLSFEGIGTGINAIRITGAGDVHVQHCVIKGFTTNGIYAATGDLYVTDTEVSTIPNGQGIYVTNARATLTRVSTNQTSVGVLVGPGGTATVKSSVSSGNQIGYAATYAASAVLNIEDSVPAHNQYGVYGGSSATARVSSSSIMNNTSQGLYNDGSASLISFGNNRFAGNTVDGSFTATITVK